MLLLLLYVLWLCSPLHAADVPAAPILSRGTGDGFLRARLPSTDIYGAALSESALRRALRDAFPTAIDVQCVSLREEDLAAAAAMADASTDLPSTFLFVFLVGRDPTKTALAPLAVDAAALQSELRLWLSASVPRLADAAASLEISLLTPSAAVALGPFPSLLTESPVAPLPPLAEGSTAVPPFLRVDVSYRNLLAPRNLTRALVYATRRGIARFLGLPSVASVVASGPPTAPSTSVLLVAQSFLVVIAAPTASVQRETRERLASLLLYGDAARLLTPASDPSTGLPGAPRPALFLDFVSTPALSMLPPVDPLELLTLPYVFSSLSVDVLPPGNPPEPPAPAPAPGVVVVPATPTSDLLARLRKTQRFALDAAGAAALQADAAAPPSTTAADLPMACPSGRFCAHVVWRNALPATRFWVERLESVDRVAWNLFPDVPLCVAPTADALNALGAAALVSPTTLSAPIVRATSTPEQVWTFSALAAPLNRLELALHLRSVDDDANATALQVELSVDWRSAVQVASTVTSIARRRGPSPQPPVYETPSNIVVTYESRVRGPNELLLLLGVQRSAVTRKDTSQPCANCQNLFDWCSAQPRCAALSTCVLRDGLETAQVPVNLLLATAPDAPQTQDVSAVFRTCLPDTSDVDALLLFTSAVRCQLQRLCPFRSTASYGLSSPADRVLRWEQTPGILALEVPALPTTAAAAISVTLRLLSTPLCSFALHAAVKSAELEDWIPRQCRFANYLGRVRVSLALGVAPSTTAQTQPQTQQRVDRLELRFEGLVGPLPTLDVPATTTGAKVAVSALPALRLRAETLDAITALPVPPPSPATNADVCQTTCRRLALDGCLRDPLCVAYTDCITRYAVPPSSGSSTSPPPLLGDAILDLFERAAVGETLSFAAAVAQCHSSDDVARASWRKLVGASACYAANACPISLALLVPQTASAVAGQWGLSPALRAQRLIYQQQEGDAAVAAAVPLSLSRQETNGTWTVVASSSSALDTAELTDNLRRLLEFDGVSARLESDTGAASSPRVMQWTVEYSYWVGALPMFIAASESPRWLLAALPTDEPSAPDCFLSMITPPPANATAASSQQSGSVTTGITATTVAVSA
ncbi:hypothetical protein ATCC90586_005622 [Pythium insidiosum]|nr:hypothetical protein ATCC90586_005622 [Pythium insidiosum]